MEFQEYSKQFLYTDSDFKKVVREMNNLYELN